MSSVQSDAAGNVHQNTSAHVHTGPEWIRLVQKLLYSPFYFILMQKFHQRTQLTHTDCVLNKKVEILRFSYGLSSVFTWKTHITVKMECKKNDKVELFAILVLTIFVLRCKLWPYKQFRKRNSIFWTFFQSFTKLHYRLSEQYGLILDQSAGWHSAWETKILVC